MRKISFGLLLFYCVFNGCGISNEMKKEQLTEEEILSVLDNSLEGDYNDFIDLGHGYFELANCRLTIFKNKNDWAIVFEKIGYYARASSNLVQMEVSYFGNCLQNLPEYNGQHSNFDVFDVENNIYETLQNNKNSITIRNKQIQIPLDFASYQKYGIDWELNANYVGAVLKYLAETNPEVTRATDEELRRCLPKNIKKIMTIDSWYQDVYHKYNAECPPSTQETFQLIAKVLVTGETSLYRPIQKPNTHWRFWLESGGL